MFENYEEINNKLAQALYNYMDEDFIEIKLEVERPSSDSISFTGVYVDESGEEKYLDFWEKDLDVGDDFHSLYTVMTTDTDKHRWNRAKVTLANDMKLNIMFEWDQKLADELAKCNKE